MFHFVFILLFSVTSALAQDQKILAIDSLRAIERIIPSSPQLSADEVLICFDIDFTLWMGTHPAANLANMKKYGKDFRKLFEGLSQLTRERIYNLSTRAADQALIEDDAPSIIRHLQQQGYRTIAFTAALCGEVADLKRHELWRYHKLKSFGLDFSQSFPHIHEKILVDIPPYNNNYPVFYKGVLCANGERSHNGKAEALVSFLRTITFQPKVIIMVDDRHETLEKMQIYFRDRHPQIQLMTLHYQRAYRLPSPFIAKQDFLHFWENIKLQALAHEKSESPPSLMQAKGTA